MSFRKHYDKPDANTAEIVADARKLGRKLWYIGRPVDLLMAWNDVLYFIEVKPPGKKLTNGQLETRRLLAEVGVELHVVYSLEDLLAIGGNDV